MKSRIAELLPLIRFGMVGLVNTGVDYILFMLLAWGGVPVMVAQIISYSCGTVNSYILNSQWTFRKRKGDINSPSPNSNHGKNKNGNVIHMNARFNHDKHTANLNPVQEEQHQNPAAHKRQLPKFIIINLIVLGLTSILLQELHSGTGLPLAVCKLIATTAGMIVNYIGSRYWVFGSPSRKESESL
jgi:putative flippase GtrA